MSDSSDLPFRARSGASPGTVSSGLLRDVQEDRPDAWSRLVRLYAPLVYYWCRQAGLQLSDAEDVTQEVFRAVAARVKTFRRDREGDTFRGWLRTITRHKLGDHFRSARQRPAAAGGTGARLRLEQLAAEEHDTSDSDAFTPAETRLLFQRVLELIGAEFEEKSRRAFTRVVMDGAKPSDVAAELGMSLNAVYLAKSRIMRRVREALAEEVT